MIKEKQSGLFKQWQIEGGAFDARKSRREMIQMDSGHGQANHHHQRSFFCVNMVTFSYVTHGGWRALLK